MLELSALIAGATGEVGVAVLLTLARLSGLVLVVSPIGSVLPGTVRAALCLLLALCLARVPVPGVDLLLADPWRLAGAGISEFGLGAVLALGVNIGFAVFTFAGRLLDIQIGFGMGQVLDPVSRQQMPVLTGIFHQLALVAFFSSAAFASFLIGFGRGLDLIPVGQAWLPGAAVAAAIKGVGGLFSLGFAMAAPVVIVLMLMDFALGVVARNLPQMNMFALAIPLKVVAGIAALAFWIGSADALVTRAFQLGFEVWSGAMS
ncbi:flagellar biosynthetic protein FliR [Roseateles sp. DAIF2]|uniref:flagellar biosynthetic protein FliR n=1 Tax=Roseateles sp. DAIF2 TaxID=2714952 RepID=UPI0018A26F20|nr:flagellar biosynthetic protein FliR [Roseateles sp. DAIF2]QPF74687.1 flagellar biosynthetic protein FliR [Roseateles sp. DAIF2]